MVTTHETLVSTTHTFSPTKQLTNTPPGHPEQPHGALASQKGEMRVWQHCHVTVSYQSPKPMATFRWPLGRSFSLSLSPVRPPARQRARTRSLARSFASVVVCCCCRNSDLFGGVNGIWDFFNWFFEGIRDWQAEILVVPARRRKGVRQRERAPLQEQGWKQVRVEAFVQDGNPFVVVFFLVRGNGRPAAWSWGGTITTMVGTTTADGVFRALQKPQLHRETWEKPFLSRVSWVCRCLVSWRPRRESQEPLKPADQESFTPRCSENFRHSKTSGRLRHPSLYYQQCQDPVSTKPGSATPATEAAEEQQLQQGRRRGEIQLWDLS